MARKKKAAEGSVGAPLYMATYGDMVTLILCFFVLLFAMSTIDAEKFRQATISLQGSLGVLRGGRTIVDDPMPRPATGDDGRSPGESPRVEMDTRHVARTIEAYLRTEGLERSIQVTLDQRGVTVSMSDQFLFTSGSAELRTDGRRVLFRIADIVRSVNFPAISVEGHTDSIPLVGGRYRDNWGLSAARAGVVASYLENEGNLPPHRLQAVAYGPNRPVVPNDTAEQRALNRRVDLVFLSQFPQ